MAITFSFIGKPVPQPRPHTTKAGHTYYPDNGIHAYRAAAAAAAKAAGATPTERIPLTMIVEWVFMRPKSHFLKDGTVRAGAPVLPRCDNKNIYSGLEDALNGICYVDDHQIGTQATKRSYGTEYRTTVRIT